MVGFVMCLLTSGCSSQKVPAEFPSKLVQFSVTLLNEGKPVEGAAVVLVSEIASSYNVVAYTGSDGVARLETSVNTYSKIGVPSGNYKALITHTPKAPSQVSNEQLGKMTLDERIAYNEKIEIEISKLPKIVPANLGDINATPITITVPESGGNTTIEITDPKTFQQ
jgi:hypothetical protein